ncbi:MAG: hypothetical protein ACRC1K_22620, partial [Planctomycetia bacterium]
MKLSLRWKLLVLIGAPLVACYGSMLAVHYYSSRAQALEGMRGRLEQLTKHHAARFDGEFSTIAQVARTTAAAVGSQNAVDADQLYRLLKRNVDQNPRVFGAGVAFDPGDPSQHERPFAPYVCRDPELGHRAVDLARSGVDFRRGDWYLIPRLLRESTWTEPHFEESAGKTLVCTHSVPFPDPHGSPGDAAARRPRAPAAVPPPGGRADAPPDALAPPRLGPGGPALGSPVAPSGDSLDPSPPPADPPPPDAAGPPPVQRRFDLAGPLGELSDHPFRGVVTVDVALDDLHDRVQQTFIDGGYCAIVSSSGTFLSHPRRDLVMQWTVFALAEWHDAPAWEQLGREMTAGRSGFQRVIDPITNRPAWVVYAPMPSSGWSFAAVIAESTILQPVYAGLQRDLSLMLVGLALMTGFLFIASFRITDPIERLATMVRRVAAGDLDGDAPVVRTR